MRYECSDVTTTWTKQVRIQKGKLETSDFIPASCLVNMHEILSFHHRNVSQNVTILYHQYESVWKVISAHTQLERTMRLATTENFTILIKECDHWFTRPPFASNIGIWQ